MTPTSESLLLSNRPTTADRLRKSFKDREYADSYARSALNAYIATQIKVIREQRGWTQGKLADDSQMKQPRIAVMEDVDYSSWSISTLWRLAQAFHLRLKVSFEEFGTLPYEIDTFSRKSLERAPLEDDPFLKWDLQPTGQYSYIQTGTTYPGPASWTNIVWVNATPDATAEAWEGWSSWQPLNEDYISGGINAQTQKGTTTGYSVVRSVKGPDGA